VLPEIHKYQPKCAGLDSKVCGDSNPSWRAGAMNFSMSVSSKGTIKTSSAGLSQTTLLKHGQPSAEGMCFVLGGPKVKDHTTAPLYFYSSVWSTVRVHCSPDPIAGLRHHSSKPNQAGLNLACYNPGRCCKASLPGNYYGNKDRTLLKLLMDSCIFYLNL